MIDILPRARTLIDDIRGDADAEAMAEIHDLAFARAWSADDFASLVSSETIVGLAVRRESPFRPRRMVGFVLMRIAADEAEVLTIAVRPALHGRGFGRALMEEALRRLYRERVASCFLEVDHGNRRAMALYRNLGFEQVGERKGYYVQPAGSDGRALVMRLRLR